MAETYRKTKIQNYISRLKVRRDALLEQLEQTKLKDMEFIKGEISAIDLIIKEIIAEFELHS